MPTDDGLILSDEELQHLAPVLREPDDDAPRLAFADWCDRRSDPRGDFIRAQIRAAATTGLSFDAEAAAATNEANLLLGKYGDLWTRFLRPYVRGGQFYRGFMMLISDSASEFLHDADRIFALAPIQQLDVTKLDCELSVFLASPHLHHLRGLSLNRAGLGDAGARTLAAASTLANLRYLSLEGNGIGIDGLEALILSPHLRKLALVPFSGNQIDLQPSVGFDQGTAVDWSPSPAASTLIQKHGARLWLDYVNGDRFSVARWLKDSGAAPGSA